MAGRRAYGQLVSAIVAGGADGIIVHKGRARTLSPELFTDCALIIHLSASTAHGPDADAKVMVGEVEDAIRLGADAVSIHLNMGSRTEAAQLADAGAVASACHAWNMPLIAMIYPRGPGIADPYDPALIAHAVNIAVDLGADIVKTSRTSQLQSLADVVDSCPIPVVVAGGPELGTPKSAPLNPGMNPGMNAGMNAARNPEVSLAELQTYAREVIAAGCAGLAVGRRVFQDPSPQRVVQSLVATIHPSAQVRSVFPHAPLAEAQ